MPFGNEMDSFSNGGGGKQIDIVISYRVLVFGETDELDLYQAGFTPWLFLLPATSWPGSDTTHPYPSLTRPTRV